MINFHFRPLDFDVDQIYGWLLSTGGSTGIIKLAAFKHRTFFKKMIDMKSMLTSFPYDGKVMYVNLFLFANRLFRFLSSVCSLRLLYLNELIIAVTYSNSSIRVLSDGAGKADKVSSSAT